MFYNDYYPSEDGSEYTDTEVNIYIPESTDESSDESVSSWSEQITFDEVIEVSDDESIDSDNIHATVGIIHLVQDMLIVDDDNSPNETFMSAHANHHIGDAMALQHDCFSVGEGAATEVSSNSNEHHPENEVDVAERAGEHEDPLDETFMLAHQHDFFYGGIIDDPLEAPHERDDEVPVERDVVERLDDEQVQQPVVADAVPNLNPDGIEEAEIPLYMRAFYDERVIIPLADLDESLGSEDTESTVDTDNVDASYLHYIEAQAEECTVAERQRTIDYFLNHYLVIADGPCSIYVTDPLPDESTHTLVSVGYTCMTAGGKNYYRLFTRWDPTRQLIGRVNRLSERYNLFDPQLNYQTKTMSVQLTQPFLPQSLAYILFAENLQTYDPNHNFTVAIHRHRYVLCNVIDTPIGGDWHQLLGVMFCDMTADEFVMDVDAQKYRELMVVLERLFHDGTCRIEPVVFDNYWRN